MTGVEQAIYFATKEPLSTDAESGITNALGGGGDEEYSNDRNGTEERHRPPRGM